MSGKIATAALLGILALPSSALGQQGRTPARSSSTGTEAQVFLQTFETIRDYFIESLGDSVLWEKALDGLIANLDDPYATVFTPDELAQFQEDNTGNYAGIGVQISGLENAITITIVFNGTPADDVGLLVGDQIVEVEGESTEGWSTADVSDRIRGRPGTMVNIKIGREGSPTAIPFTLKRDNVHVEAVHSDFVYDSIGYILFDRVTRGSAAEVDAALQQLSSAKGIILDLRRNPGGFLDESLRISDLLLDPGQNLASTKSRAVGRGGERAGESWDAQMPARLPGKPIIVLVDESTASAAEIVAGAWQDHDRALVLGDRTFGKGVVQTLLPLPAGRYIRLTTGEWATPLGRSLHRPRDRSGRLLDESADRESMTVATASGRTIQAGGGIFPDVVIQDDTLTLAERNLFTAAGQAEVPLNLRIAEFALRIARSSLAENRPPLVSTEEFDAFVDALLQEGLPAEAFEPEGVRPYLFWRARIAAAERADALGLAMQFRTERDPVLTAAIELLQHADSQAALFQEAQTMVGASRRASGRTGG